MDAAVTGMALHQIYAAVEETELEVGDSKPVDVHWWIQDWMRGWHTWGVKGVRLRDPRTELEGSGTRTMSDERMDFEDREILESNPAHTFSKRA